MSNTNITIVADPESRTIYAVPDHGHVYHGIVGDTITWTCARPFAISFLELTATGGTLTGGSAGAGGTISVTLPEQARKSFHKYTITVGNLVLDPYIGVDH